MAAVLPVKLGSIGQSQIGFMHQVCCLKGLPRLLILQASTSEPAKLTIYPGNKVIKCLPVAACTGPQQLRRFRYGVLRHPSSYR